MKPISKFRWSRRMSGIGLAAVLIGGCASIPAPTEQVAASKTAVSNAASAGGNEYASANMREAQDKLERAVQAMAEQDYQDARLLAEQAEVDAQLAASKARAAKAQEAAVTVLEDSRVLREEIDRK